MGQLQTTKNIGQLAEEVIQRCQRLATFSENEDGLRRTFLSPPMREVHREIAVWLGAVDVTTSIDAAGNLRGFYAGTDASAPRLLIGSHLDTVPNAGAFDGILGVVIGVALLEALDGRRLPYAIEIIGFSEEEGVRFGTPFIGSRALVGRLDEELLSQRDLSGISVREAIANFGLSSEELANIVLHDVCAYLEFHIEQGPVLESLKRPLGAVEAITGQTRMNFVFRGRSNHAGTTPMDLRFDAMAGAAEWITAAERIAKATPGLVATVGSVETRPGATNVIASEVRLSLDVRHASDHVRHAATARLAHEAEEICQRRGLSISSNTRMDQPAVPMDTLLTQQIEKAIHKTGNEPMRMVSGAGHDAMILAEKVPSSMIFLRTPGGISHNPAESVSVEDVAKAIECGLHLLEQFADLPTFQSRTRRA
jgi:allantoate deiminase